MSKLTDEELVRLEQLRADADEWPEYEYTGGSYSEHRDLAKASADFYKGAHSALPAMISELRSVRGQGVLSEADRDALAYARADIQRAMNPVGDDGCDCWQCRTRRSAIAILDRLIRANGGVR